MSDSNRVQLRYVEETTWGTIPSTLDLQELRFTGESLAYNIENIKSNEIRNDRQTNDLIQTGASASGGIEFEFSPDTYDDFLEGALWSDWSADLAISETTIAATASGFTDSGDNFGNVVAGQWIKVAGFTGNSGENNGYYLVTGISTGGGGTLETSPAPESVEAAGATVSVTGSVLRNGTTEHSYSIERLHEDLTPDVYFPFSGMVVNALNMSISSKAIVTGNFEFVGESCVIATGAMSSGSVTDATSTDVYSASADAANILEDDTAVADCLVKEMSFALNNNVRGLDAVGQMGNCDIGVGEVDLSGTLNAYFKNRDLYEKYQDATSTSLSFRLANDTDVYIFTFHNIKFETDPVNTTGANSDVMDNMTWRALRHATYDCMIQIDKFAA